MRDISNLIKKEKPEEQKTDEDMLREYQEYDNDLINNFHDSEPTKDSIGHRPWT